MKKTTVHSRNGVTKHDRLHTAKLLIQGFTEEVPVNSLEGEDIWTA